jgi:hypothetical protein
MKHIGFVHTDMFTCQLHMLELGNQELTERYHIPQLQNDTSEIKIIKKKCVS